MREHPILFSAPMVRALLDGSKTQTRRVIKNPYDSNVWTIKPASNPRYHAHTHDWWLPDAITPAADLKCPYGNVGDQLWVRETFCPIYPQEPTYNNGEPIEYDYAATYKYGDRLGDTLGIKKIWKPSIHMPRKASRIQLEITDIGVENLQSITYNDAIDEGISYEKGYTDPRDAFKRLWESINGAGSWNANPWVWVIEFKVVKP